MELYIHNIGDIVFKYTWAIKRYSKIAPTQESFDSPHFDMNINGIHMKWGLSIRFWKGDNGCRLLNPIVLCLNQIPTSNGSTAKNDPDSSESSSSSESHSKHQTHLNFQFGLFNHELGREEPTTVTGCVLPGQPIHGLVSVGYKEVRIKKQHLDEKGNLMITVKIQMCPDDNKLRHSLSNDMFKMMEGIHHCTDEDIKTDQPDIVVLTAQGENFPVHRSIMACRSKVFAEMFNTPVGVGGHTVHQSITCETPCATGEVHKFDIDDISKECLQELISYIYSDRVIGLDTHAQALLAAAERYGLPGLKTICAKSLAFTIKPDNVANLLLLADRCHCDTLKQEALSYCEGHSATIGKNLAWKVMEMISPQLFQEACEVGIGDSNSSNIDSLNSYEAEAV